MALRNLFPGLEPEDSAVVSNENFRLIDNRFRTNIVKNIDGTSRIIQGKLPYDGGYGTLYYDNTGTPRYIVGILPDGTLGQQASKPGVSVVTNDDNDLAFKSDFSSTTYHDNTGIPRYIVGTLPDGTLGQQASRPGASVLTTDTDNLVSKSDFGATTYYDGAGTPIAIIGNLPDGDIGIVIAKPGENVLDAFA